MKTEQVMQLWAQIREGTIETIDKYTDQDLTFVAYKGGFSVGEIILHIAHEEYGEIQYGLAYTLNNFPTQFSDERYETIESLKKKLRDTHQETIVYLQSLKDSDLSKEFDAQWGERKALIAFIIHVIEHEIHHRGELSLILGLLGHKGYDA